MARRQRYKLVGGSAGAARRRVHGAVAWSHPLPLSAVDQCSGLSGDRRL